MNAAGSAAGPGIHRPGGLLWHRDFRLLWFGETVSQVGTAMAVVAMPLAAVTVLHAGTFAVTALVAYDLAAVAADRAAGRGLGGQAAPAGR